MIVSTYNCGISSRKMVLGCPLALVGGAYQAVLQAGRHLWMPPRSLAAAKGVRLVPY